MPLDNSFLISSLQNPKIKELLALRERKTRDTTQKYLIEGYRELLRAQQAGVPIEALFFSPEFFLKENEPALIASIQAKKYQCTERVFAKISYRDRPDGLLAVARQQHRPLEELGATLPMHPFLVVVESIEKPGNLGTILRSADALGVDALLVCDKCTDLFNPNTVRASVGTLFSVPIVETSSQEAMRFLKEKQITIVAATPEAETVLWKANLKEAVAIVLGSEQYGLSDFWRQESTLRLKIPMHGQADSLNVAMACTLMLYETRRQRDASAY